jgi:hypothetical protein
LFLESVGGFTLHTRGTREFLVTWAREPANAAAPALRLAAIERYPDWNPYVTCATIESEHDGWTTYK